MITRGVGRGEANISADVVIVQRHLARHRQWVYPEPWPEANGNCGTYTINAILEFQRHACSLLAPDGRISPRGFTYQRLQMANIPFPAHRVFQSMCWAHTGGSLTLADYTGAATRLRCEVNAIRAVANVETKKSPYDELGRPTILYERHKFRTHSNGRYNLTHPDISGPQGGYGLFRVQYSKLYRAAVLDEVAALKSASYGMFQILGENHVAAGFPTVGAFVDAMMGEERDHLAAFVSFILANPGMLTALRNRNWATFARLYNGPNYRDNDYDTKMQTEYERLEAAARPARRR
jgi:hypothetical protein